MIIKMMPMMMIDMLHQIFVVVEVISLKKNSKNNNIFFFFLESPSRAQWDDDDSDKRRSQWEYPTPSDRQGYRKRDTDYYNRYEYIIVEFLGNFLLCFFLENVMIHHYQRQVFVKVNMKNLMKMINVIGKKNKK